MISRHASIRLTFGNEHGLVDDRPPRALLVNHRLNRPQRVVGLLAERHAVRGTAAANTCRTSFRSTTE